MTKLLHDQTGGPVVKKLLWDFFGPRADGTAAHFLIHLQQFLSTHGVTGCSTGLESSGQGHRAVYCLTPTESVDAVVRSLRPQRVAAE